MGSSNMGANVFIQVADVGGPWRASETLTTSPALEMEQQEG